MKILTDIRLLSKGGSSGIEEYTQELLRALLRVDTGNSYQYFYNGFRKAAPPAFLKRSSCIVDWHIPNKALDVGARILNEPKLERALDFDLVFSPHFTILATKKPRVITFHDLSFVHHPEFFSRRNNLWHWLQGYAGQARQAAQIIAVSEFTKSDLVTHLNIPPERITTIYSGVNDAFKVLPRDSEEMRRFLFAHNLDKPYVLSMGTLEPRKNTGALVRAFDILKQDPVFRDLQLVIAGRPGWLYDDILRQIHNSPFREDIRFLGRVRTSDRVLLYNAASLFVYPSFFEGFGFPPLEAQACGIPVIASNRTSLPEILGDSAVLIDPWRIDELASAMREVLESPSASKKLVQLGLRNAERFDWEEAAKKTLKVFGNVRT